MCLTIFTLKFVIMFSFQSCLNTVSLITGVALAVSATCCLLQLCAWKLNSYRTVCPETCDFLHTNRERAETECVYGRYVGADSALCQCPPPWGCRTPGTSSCLGMSSTVTQSAPHGTWGLNDKHWCHLVTIKVMWMFYKILLGNCIAASEAGLGSGKEGRWGWGVLGKEIPFFSALPACLFPHFLSHEMLLQVTRDLPCQAL